MKIGDYVRTDTGQIGKITYFEGDMVRVDCDKFITYKSNHNEITKISPNIIDLIEVGDYVNGLKVTNVGGTYHGRKDKAIYCDYCENKETGKWTMIYDDEIKSIVTKEMYSSVEYRVETD